MGGVWSSLEEEGRQMREKEMEDFLERLNDGRAPDLRVNKSIVMFSGLRSSDNLRKHYEKRKREAGGSAVDLIKTLAGKLGEYIPASALGGLGPLAIVVLIDLVSLSLPEESTEDALRSVFAEEKASEVWDQIDECLKRCVMHINNDQDLATDIRRIECRLSAAITKLKNSMVRDGHMSSQALKAWVNGAAFHIQMLIHLVRLGGTRTCDPVETLLSTYLRDLDALFIKHREMVQAKCRLNVAPGSRAMFGKRLIDDDLNVSYQISNHGGLDESFEIYYHRRYNRQKTDIKRYLGDVRDNLQTLVNQRGYFTV